MRTNKAIFLDRDGILVIPRFSNGRSFAPRSINEFKFYKNIKFYLNKFKELGYLNIVVTNQPDIQNGLLSLDVLKKMNRKILNLLPIDDIEFCIHNSKSNCRRRKPNVGMLEDASKKWNIDLKNSFMIGDRKSDIDSGNQLGIKTIFVDYNYIEKKPLNANFFVDNIYDAFCYILKLNLQDDK